MKQEIKSYILDHGATLNQALRQMDKVGCKVLIIEKNSKFRGLVSIGDIQRAIIRNLSLDEEIEGILREKIKVAHPNDNFEEIKKQMISRRIELMPVVDEDNKVVEVFLWKDLFEGKKIAPAKKFDFPVVIMAGGLGSRLKPLTNVLPKPLIPIGEKSIIENIIDDYAHHGCHEFYISVNYKAEFIEYYLNSKNLPYKLSFLRENIPLGTAGSLSLLKNELTSTFFVSNCDILIEEDYSVILDFHIKNKNDITIVAALKHYPIPYGIIEAGENGALLSIQEKPELTFKINSGMYILEKHVLDAIPENTFYHITQLINDLKNNGGNIGVFPVTEKSWVDIGDWSEYLNKINLKY